MNKKALILSGVSWNTTLQRHHKIALWLKNIGYDVYFIESIPSSSFTLKKVFSKVKNKFIKSTSVNNFKTVKVFNFKFLPPNYIFNHYNSYKVNKMLKKIGNSFDVVINYLPIYTTKTIIDYIVYNKLIYDCVRDFENWGGYPRNIKKYENLLKEKSNIIMTDSFYLTNKHNGIQFLPSLSEEQLKIFNSNKKTINKIKKIVYFGQIDTHIDVNVLEAISKEYELHIIGNSNIALKFEYIDHGFISNKEQLALKLKEFDAIIIPYKGNMDGVIPAKLMESLASGMPVYISSFYDSEKLSKYCYVYHSIDELMSLLKNYKKNEKKDCSKIIHNNTEEKQLIKFKELLK